MSFSKKKIGFFSTFLVGLSILSIPSLLLCLGTSKMKQNQINISSNQSVSIYGTSTPNLIFGGNADDYTFQYCDEEIYMTENDYEKINPSYINVNYIRGYIFHKTVFLYFRFYFEQESSGTSV
jgi:hypothetical protein